MDLKGYTTVDEVGEDPQDEVPKYYQKTALAQTLVDKCKDIPLVGLQYVLEVRKDLDLTVDGCYYICAVCSKKMTALSLVAHIKSVPHRLKFCETHCKHIHDKYASYDVKNWTAALVREFTAELAEIERKMGRHKLAVAFERDISSVLKALKQKISEISNLSKIQEEKGKPSTQPGNSTAPAAKKASPVVVVKDVPLPPAPPAKDAGPAADPPKKEAPKPKPPTGPKVGSIAKNYDEPEDDADDVVLVSDKVSDNKNAGNDKKFSSNGQGFTKRNYRPGPNTRHRTTSRSPSPAPTLKKTLPKSKSPSPKRKGPPLSSMKHRNQSRSPHRRPDRALYVPGRKRRHSRSPVSPRRRSRSRSSSRDAHKHHRTRSRSRSRHRSPHRKGSWNHRSPPWREPSEERARRVARRKLEDFREAEMRIRAKHKNQMVMYEKTPESHPQYSHEWKIFWEHRCRELQKEGVDPFHHDFKSEWARFWHTRMKQIMDQTYKFKRESLLRKLRLDDPDLEENKNKDKTPSSSWRPEESTERLSRIDRSPSPWEKDEVVARNPSPTPEDKAEIKESTNSKSNDNATSKFEDDFSVIGTLKLLNELEDQLGSFGPAISTLLGKAVDCSQKGEDTLELFKDPDNLVLVRYAREKLSSQVSAGILGVTALVRTQMAVERSMWLQSQAERLANEGKYLGLDIAGIARATVGRDTVQIAQYIAQHLLQVGKSNASEADLQNILYAVLAAHTKLMVETSSKVQVETPVVETVFPASAPATTVSRDPPQDLPSTPGEASEGGKQPLFPSAASKDVSENDDSNVGDETGDSSDRMGGLSLLQSAYEEENGKEMENLSLDDLRSLLSNFSSLNAEEKQALTTYLKKLEATDSKKVMKLREEIQKSAKNASKAGNIKSALKSGKTTVRPQSAPKPDASNPASQQQQPSEVSQSPAPVVKEGREPPPPQTVDDKNTRPNFMENVNPPVGAPQDRFGGSSEPDVMQDSRGRPGPPPKLNPSPHNMPPAPGEMGMPERMQDYGPNMGPRPDHRPRHGDEPMFDDGRNRPFPQRPFSDRPEPGFGNQDRNFDRFDYEQGPRPGPNSGMAPQNPGRYDRPPELNNPQWQGFGRGGPHRGMDDRPHRGMDDRPPMGMDDRPPMGMDDRPRMGMDDRPHMGMNERPHMGMNDRPQMGMSDRPHMGMDDRPHMGMDDRPHMGMSDRPHMGMSDRPHMGMNDRPHMGMNDRPHMGMNDRPHMGMNDRPHMGMDDRAFPPRDGRNWFEEGPQPPFEQRGGPGGPPMRGRPDYPFRGGAGRGFRPNMRQPYRDPW